jgi:hypothetical protein
MMYGHEKSDPAIEADEQSGAIRRGVGGAKGRDRGECAPTKHAPDAEPGKRDTGRWLVYGSQLPSIPERRESRTYGSGRGARGNSRPYREGTLLHCICLFLALTVDFPQCSDTAAIERSPDDMRTSWAPPEQAAKHPPNRTQRLLRQELNQSRSNVAAWASVATIQLAPSRVSRSSLPVQLRIRPSTLSICAGKSSILGLAKLASELQRLNYLVA